MKTNFSDSKMWTGKLKAEMRYEHIVRHNHYWKLKKTTVSKLEAVAHVFCGNGILRNFAGQPTTLSQNRLWHKCFPVNFAKLLTTPFLKEYLTGKHMCWSLFLLKTTPFFTEHLQWLLLKNEINPFQFRSLSLPPENTRNFWLPDVFRGYRKRQVA